MPYLTSISRATVASGYSGYSGTGSSGYSGISGYSGATGAAGTGAQGRVYYFNSGQNTTVGQYETFTLDPSSGTTDTATASATSSSGEVLCVMTGSGRSGFCTNQGDPGITAIPVGTITWKLRFHVSDNTATNTFVIRLYKVLNVSPYTETQLFYFETTDIDATTQTQYTFENYITEPVPLDPTDLVLTKIYFKTTSATSVTGTFTHDGSTTQSYVITPISTGLSGVSGWSGYSGSIGTSGFSGYSGAVGTSGWSGYSGVLGTSGFSGWSGYSGQSGWSGYSGLPGFNSFIKKTSNVTVAAGDQIIADTTGGTFTITLPATPSEGNCVIIADGGNWATNNLYVSPNGSTVEGSSYDNVVLDVTGVLVYFVYDGTTWEVSATLGSKGYSGYSGAAGASSLTEAPSNQQHSGTIVSMTYGESLVPGDLVYFDSTGVVKKADANVTGKYPVMGLALETASSGSHNILLNGIYRDDSRYNFTVGGLVYLSTTAGAETQTQPSATDDVIQIVGVATHADRIYFNPQLTYITHA